MRPAAVKPRRKVFSFLKLTNPTWYYNLVSQSREQYWVIYRSEIEDSAGLVDFHSGYSSVDSKMWDAAYQAWLKGSMKCDSVSAGNTLLPASVGDEYLFLRRHFNPMWSLFAFTVRVFELNNPFLEAKGLWAARNVKRIDPYQRIVDHRKDMAAFESQLVNSKAMVSVIIPTLNRYQYLKDVLSDLEKQTYSNFEVIVVDQSVPFDAGFYSQFDLDLKFWYQEERALWRARNEAIQSSEGEYILLFDDDSRVGPDWIESHLRALDYFDVEISSGVSISKVGDKVPKTYSHYKWGDQIDTGNAMVKKDVFRKIGLFDRQFEKQRQGDGEFGLRAYLAGFKNVSNPDASRLHLKVSEGGLREMGSWDGWRPKNFFAPRPIPSVLYLTRKYFGNRAAVYQILGSVFPSIIPYQFKKHRSMLVIGAFIGLLMLPLISISVVRSWHAASKKLAEGARIPTLE